MEIKEIPIEELKPAEYNPRYIDKAAILALQESIKKFGFVEPVVINKDFTIIGGHQRVEVAKLLEFKTVPCYIVDLDKKSEKKLNVVLNSSKLAGTFDQISLDIILQELKLDDDYVSLRLDDLETFDPTTFNEEAGKEWEDMPEFSNVKSIYAKSIVFHFKSKQDFEEFMDKNGLDYTDNTKYITI